MHNIQLQAAFDAKTYGHNWFTTRFYMLISGMYLMLKDEHYAQYTLCLDSHFERQHDKGDIDDLMSCVVHNEPAHEEWYKDNGSEWIQNKLIIQ